MNEYIIKKKKNPARIVAYTFIGLFYLSLSLATLTVFPTILFNEQNIINYNIWFIVQHVLISVLFSGGNIFIMYKISKSNPLHSISDYTKKKIRLSIYIINTLMLTIFMILTTLSVATRINPLGIEEFRLASGFAVLSSIISSFIINFFLLSLSLPLTEEV